MSVINMFRKEALRHQYKSQEFGHSVIKQPSIISNAIIGLCAFMLVGVIGVQFVTLTTNQAYDIQLSSENYQPQVMSKTLVIEKHMVKEGAKVNRDQVLAKLVTVGEGNQAHNQEVYLRATGEGYYFHANTDSNVIRAFEPIGYLLKDAQPDGFAFWLKEKPKSPVMVGGEVILEFDGKQIKGQIAMVIGVFSHQRGQKVLVHFKDKRHISLLSPNTHLKMVLQQQPRTIAELLGK